MVDVVDGEEGWIPAVAGDACVQPIFGSGFLLGVWTGVGGLYGAYPFGPVVDVTSSVAPLALGLDPTPGFADWAVEWAARAKVARAMGLRLAIADIESLIWS